MVDWFYIGYCTVMAMLAIAFAYAAVFGFRALRGLQRSFRLAFAAVAIVTTLAAQKTNNVPPNMSSPLPQMMQGGLSQTGFPGLTGFVGEGNLVFNLSPVVPIEFETAIISRSRYCDNRTRRISDREVVLGIGSR